jgi:class 3 adenylate cyclase
LARATGDALKICVRALYADRVVGCDEPSALSMQCTNCQRELRDDASYCDQCGTRLVAQGRSILAATRRDVDGSASRQSVDAERRWVTIMFCDLVGSAALSERLEAEDMRSLLGLYQQACKAAVELHGGSIARYVGDGLLVYFGYPESHEDAPRRASR